MFADRGNGRRVKRLTWKPQGKTRCRGVFSVCLFLIYCCCVIERTSNPGKKIPALSRHWRAVFLWNGSLSISLYSWLRVVKLQLWDLKETYTVIEEVNGVWTFLIRKTICWQLDCGRKRKSAPSIPKPNKAFHSNPLASVQLQWYWRQIQAWFVLRHLYQGKFICILISLNVLQRLQRPIWDYTLNPYPSRDRAGEGQRRTQLNPSEKNLGR